MHTAFVFWDFCSELVIVCEMIAYCYRWCHLISFVWCFGYIAFFRTAHMFGLPEVVPHANAVQLFVTLRVQYSFICSIEDI